MFIIRVFTKWKNRIEKEKLRRDAIWNADSYAERIEYFKYMETNSISRVEYI